jgi:hypothetical protein
MNDFLFALSGPAMMLVACGFIYWLARREARADQ